MFFNYYAETKRQARLKSGLCEGCGKEYVACSCKKGRHWRQRIDTTPFERAILRFYDKFAENQKKKSRWNRGTNIDLILNKKKV